MADRLKKAAVWLGLATDHEYAEAVAGADDVTEEVLQRPSSAPAAHSVTELESRRPVAPQPRMADISRIITVHPRTYNEAKTIGENFREGIPVIMNLTDMEESDAKRLVDFAAGLVFGLHGSIERVTNKVFLLSPETVEVNAEEYPSTPGRTLFNQS